MNPSTASKLPEQILVLAASLQEGEPLQAKALLHLGRRAAIDQALGRLVRGGKLMRAGRGLYLAPIETRFGRRAPDSMKVLTALWRISRETIARSPASAANALGLTTQVPVREIYLTSGKSRILRMALGPETEPAVPPIEIELRHAPSWQLVLANKPAGEVIRAIAWAAGEGGQRKRGRPSGGLVDSRERAAARTLRKVLGLLPPGTLEELASARPLLPSWIAQPVSRMLATGSSPRGRVFL